MSEQGKQEEVKRYAYVEPMGHGSHFVAEIAPETLIPGTVQFNILRGDGTIDRTVGMNGGSIFRWSSVGRENALVLARMLEQRQSMYDVSIPQRLLLEASKENAMPDEKEDNPDALVDAVCDGNADGRDYESETN